MQKFSEWARLAFFVVWTLVGIAALVMGAKMSKDKPYSYDDKMMDYRQDVRQDIRENVQDRMMYRQDAVQQQTAPAEGGTVMPVNP